MYKKKKNLKNKEKTTNPNRVGCCIIKVSVALQTAPLACQIVIRTAASCRMKKLVLRWQPLLQ